MKTIDEIRRENLRNIANGLGGVAQLAEQLQKNYAQVSQWLNGSKDSKTKKPRGMRDESVRWIESCLHKPRGWLDKDHSKPNKRVQETRAEYAVTPHYPLEVIIAALNAIDQHVEKIEKAWNAKAKSGLRGAVLAEVLQSYPQQQLWQKSAYLDALLVQKQADLDTE